jgi:hypothetical protein
MQRTDHASFVVFFVQEERLARTDSRRLYELRTPADRQARAHGNAATISSDFAQSFFASSTSRASARGSPGLQSLK